jgi:hypothetical protein
MSPTESPTNRGTSWYFGAEGQNCNLVCTSVGGTCNIAAQNAVDTALKIEFVVEVELARDGLPLGTYGGGLSQANPLFAGSYFCKCHVVIV